MSRVFQAQGSRYVIHAPLGQGGMAVVHRGTMVTPAGVRQVAIKQLMTKDQLAATERDTDRIVAEAKLVFQLNHANICQVLDLGTSHDGAFIVMELVEGLDLHTLGQRLRREDRFLDVPMAVHIAREVAQALDYAHRRLDETGRSLLLVHGDVTPKNILLSIEGEVKLADFGIARALRANAPGNSLRGGTPGFIAPEIHGAAPVSQKADIYSLGVSLYVSLGGAPPHKQPVSPRALATRRPEIHAELIQIIERACAPRREDRFLSAGDFERALAFYLARHHPSFTPSALAEVVRQHAPSDEPPQTSQGEERTLVSLTHDDVVTTFGSSVSDLHSLVKKTETDAAPLSRRRPLLWVALASSVAIAAALKLVDRRPADAASAPPPAPPVSASAPTPSAVPMAPSPAPAPAPAPDPAPPKPDPVPSSRASAKPAVRTKRRIAAPEAARPAAVSAPIGYLAINSSPWGAVFVDGHEVAQQTPVYRLPTPAGRHQVTIYNPARKEHSPPQDVTVKPGQVKVLGFKW